MDDELARAIEHIKWLIPMAKAWANEHPVGQNRTIVNDAENYAFLAQAKPASERSAKTVDVDCPADGKWHGSKFRSVPAPASEPAGHVFLKAEYYAQLLEYAQIVQGVEAHQVVLNGSPAPESVAADDVQTERDKRVLILLRTIGEQSDIIANLERRLAQSPAIGDDDGLLRRYTPLITGSMQRIDDGEYVLFDDYRRLWAELQEARKGADQVRYLLPLAKGYAHEHPVGLNQVLCNDAAEWLQEARKK